MQHDGSRQLNVKDECQTKITLSAKSSSSLVLDPLPQIEDGQLIFGIAWPVERIRLDRLVGAALHPPISVSPDLEPVLAAVGAEGRLEVQRGGLPGGVEGLLEGETTPRGEERDRNRRQQGDEARS